MAHPAGSHFTAANVAAYWEYVAQHFGVLEAADAMDALKQLWVWAIQNQCIPYQDMPSFRGATASIEGV